MLSFLSAFTYNQINLKNLPKEKIRENETVITNDDYSYIYHPQHYSETGVWSERSIRDQSLYFRPPGYGIIYYTILKTIGKPNSLFALKILQLLLFSFSVYWFYYITKSLVNNNKIALIASSIYGMSPFAIGFLYYTLTEGVTPSILLFYIFLLFKAFNNESPKSKSKFYLAASIIFSFIFLIRPALGPFSMLLPIFLIKDYWNSSFKTTLFKIIILYCFTFCFL